MLRKDRWIAGSPRAFLILGMTILTLVSCAARGHSAQMLSTGELEELASERAASREMASGSREAQDAINAAMSEEGADEASARDEMAASARDIREDQLSVEQEMRDEDKDGRQRETEAMAEVREADRIARLEMGGASGKDADRVRPRSSAEARGPGEAVEGTLETVKDSAMDRASQDVPEGLESVKDSSKDKVKR